jgi:hypothetical protein
MGGISSAAPGRRWIDVQVEGLEVDQRLVVVRDGKPLRIRLASEVTIPLREAFTIDAPSFVRIEVHDDSGAIALGNPIYFAPGEDPSLLPAARTR